MKKHSLKFLISGVIIILLWVLLYERDQAMDSEGNVPAIPVTRTVEIEHIVNSAEISHQQDSAETTPTIRTPARNAIEEASQIMLPPISYSLWPQAHDQNIAMLPEPTPLSFSLSVNLSALADELDLERECRNHNSIVSRSCTPSLANEPESAMLISIDTEKNSNAYQIDCGSLLENVKRHDESSGLREQCLGGINIGGKNWDLELWGAMTYRIDPNEEKVEIIPCPEGELTECTTLGVGLKVDIP